MEDPVERIVADALERAGVEFQRDSVEALDFYLPDFETHIECKQFFTPRVAGQLKRAPDVILIQGKHAANVFAYLLTGSSANSNGGSDG